MKIAIITEAIAALLLFVFGNLFFISIILHGSKSPIAAYLLGIFIYLMIKRAYEIVVEDIPAIIKEHDTNAG